MRAGSLQDPQWNIYRTATVPGEEENSTAGNRENKVLTEIIKTKLLKSFIVQTLEYFLLSCE